MRKLAVIGVMLMTGMGSARAQSYVVIAEPGVDEGRVAVVSSVLGERGERVVELLWGKAATVAVTAEVDAALTRARSALADARNKYIALELAAAIAELERVELELATDLLASSAGVALLTELNVWLGNLLIADRRVKEGEARFAQALGLAPELVIDRATFPPEVTEVFTRVKEGGVGQPASLTLDTRPQAARVAVDGRPRREQTPATITAAAGWHYVRLQRSGFRPWAQRLAFTVGAVSEVPVALAKASPHRLSADLATVMRELYPSDSAAAVAVVASATGAGRVVVVGGTGLVLYDGAGKRLAVASGGDARAATESLFSNATGSKRELGPRPLYKKWWFWTAVGGVLATSAVVIYAVTDDDTLRGRFPELR